MGAPPVPHTGTLRMRPAGPADAAFLRMLFVTARPHLSGTGLPREQADGLIDMQLRAQRAGLAASYALVRDIVIECDERPAGRLVLGHGAAITIADLAVLPELRGQGIATGVLRLLCAEADARGVSLHLTVAYDNPARRLYERMGFAPIGSSSLDVLMERTAR